METPVNNVNGIGPKTVEILNNHHIITAEALIDFGAEKLAGIPGFNMTRAANVIKEANKLISSQQSATTKSSNKTKMEKKGKKNKKDKKSKNKKK